MISNAPKIMVTPALNLSETGLEQGSRRIVTDSETTITAPPWGFCTLVLETRSGLDCTMWTTERLEEKRSFLAFYFEAKIVIMNRSDDKNLYLVLLKNLLTDSGFWF